MARRSPLARRARCRALELPGSTGTAGPGWTNEERVLPSNGDPNDLFGGGGISLSVDGSTLVVTAPSEGSSTTGIDSTPDNNAGQAGAAYVFGRGNPSYVQQAYIKASN